MQVKSITCAQELFDKADRNGDGKLTLEELCDVLRKASKVCSPLLYQNPSEKPREP